MSLLTPSEAMAFQSFLSSIDYPDSYHPTPSELLVYSHGVYDIKKEHPHSKSKDALARATLDFMSLDTPSPSSASPTTPSWFNFPAPRDPITSASKPHFRYQMGRDPVPIVPPRSQPERPRIPYSVDRQCSFDSRNSSSSSPSPGPPIVCPSPSYPSISVSSRPPLPRLRTSAKRSFDPLPSNPTPLSSASTKRTRYSPPAPHSLAELSISLPSPLSTTSSTPTSVVPSSRPALLSSSQKRANHIQSEQKRRANIRKGYEALCETIPTLREAIRREEEEAAAAAISSGTTGSAGNAKGRRRKSKGASDDDKVDGRAGPKSENIVLQKTIDYIQELNSSKESLMKRLEHARRVLGPGHPIQYPSVIPQDGVPLWDREWNGGLGLSGDDVSDDDAQ